MNILFQNRVVFIICLLVEIPCIYIRLILTISDGAYKTALDSLVKAEAELRRTYPENNNILNVYQSADIDLHNLSNCNEFRIGFKVGAQIVLEMMKPIKWGGKATIRKRQTSSRLPNPRQLLSRNLNIAKGR